MTRREQIGREIERLIAARCAGAHEDDEAEQEDWQSLADEYEDELWRLIEDAMRASSLGGFNQRWRGIGEDHAEIVAVVLDEEVSANG